MLVLSDDEVRQAALSIDWIGALEVALARQSDGALDLPNRLTVNSSKGVGWYRFMPVVAYDLGFAGYKAMNFHPIEGVRYIVVLIDIDSGETVAMLDGNWITAYRTAGAAAIAARRLARPGRLRLGVIGTGVQARALLETVTTVLDFDGIEVFSRKEQNRSSFAVEMSTQLGRTVEPADELSKMAVGSDVVMSAIRAGHEPVIAADDIAEGAVVCGISSVRPEHREVDTKLWVQSDLVVVDDFVHFQESGDGRAVAADPAADLSAAVELWEVLRDDTKGRTADHQRVLYKSVGTAEQDIALAAVLLRQAKELGLGRDLGSFPGVRRFR